MRHSLWNAIALPRYVMICNSIFLFSIIYAIYICIRNEDRGVLDRIITHFNSDKLFILFSDILNDKRRVTFELPRSDDAVMLSDNEKTITTLGSGSINTNSERIPVRNDSQDSQVSDSDISVTNRNQASVCIIFH